jgi:Homeodomain-like domain-containing protein
VLVELGVVEQRYRAVLEVLDDGVSVTDVARRYGVARQTVHDSAVVHDELFAVVAEERLDAR